MVKKHHTPHRRRRGTCTVKRKEKSVCLDLQKAFDTMDQAALLKKRNFGCKLSKSWLTSYLSGRVQVTDVDGTIYVAISLFLVML